MDWSDEDCVRRCLDGEPGAFRELVERHQARLLSYLTGRLRDTHRAEEAAQEAFVRSYFALRKLRKPGSFFAWLVGIADRVAREQQRAARRHRDLARSAPASGHSDPEAGDPELERALAGLSDPYRRVVVLRYYSGLSCAEIGESLDIPLGTVTKRTCRASS